MSAQAKQEEQSQNQNPPDQNQAPKTDPTKVKDTPNGSAEQGLAGGDNQESKSPEKAADDQLGTIGETDAQKFAKAVDAICKMNPDLPIEDVIEIVKSSYKKVATPETQIEKEAKRIIKQAANTDIKKRVYFKKDKERKFPMDESVLNGMVVRQTYKKKTEEGDDITVPARNLNEIAVYSQEDYDRLSETGRGFEREGITVEVWHKPGDKNTVQED